MKMIFLGAIFAVLPILAAADTPEIVSANASYSMVHGNSTSPFYTKTLAGITTQTAGASTQSMVLNLATASSPTLTLPSAHSPAALPMSSFPKPLAK